MLERELVKVGWSSVLKKSLGDGENCLDVMIPATKAKGWVIFCACDMLREGGREGER